MYAARFLAQDWAALTGNPVKFGLSWIVLGALPLLLTGCPGCAGWTHLAGLLTIPLAAPAMARHFRLRARLPAAQAQRSECPLAPCLTHRPAGFHSVFLVQHFILYRGREPLALADQRPSLLTGRLSGLLTGRLPSMALPGTEVQLTYAALPPVDEGAEWEEEEEDESNWPPPLLTAPSG